MYQDLHETIDRQRFVKCPCIIRHSVLGKAKHRLLSGTGTDGAFFQR